MKKYLILALLFIPMAAFSAPSVRVLGNNTASAGNNTNVVAKKATPAKAAPAATNNSTSSRVGTVRAKTTGTVSSAKSGSESRFPVIAPSHTYSSVTSPKSTGGTTVVNNEVDTDAIVDTVMQQVENNYYSKTEVYNNNNFNEAVQAQVDEDPRVYAISTFDPKRDSNSPRYGQDAPTGWVYMWVED